METETEVKTVKVNLKCPDCEIILQMKCASPRQDGPNQKYEYKCLRCGMTTFREIKYPFIKYVPV